LDEGQTAQWVADLESPVGEGSNEQLARRFRIGRNESIFASALPA
jgi:hypothetical protein